MKMIACLGDEKTEYEKNIKFLISSFARFPKGLCDVLDLRRHVGGKPCCSNLESGK